MANLGQRQYFLCFQQYWGYLVLYNWHWGRYEGQWHTVKEANGQKCVEAEMCFCRLDPSSSFHRGLQMWPKVETEYTGCPRKNALSDYYRAPSGQKRLNGPTCAFWDSYHYDHWGFLTRGRSVAFWKCVFSGTPCILVTPSTATHALFLNKRTLCWHGYQLCLMCVWKMHRAHIPKSQHEELAREWCDWVFL